MLSVKMLENSPSGMFLRNDVIGLNSNSFDTNPPRLHAVAEGAKLTAMTNTLVDGKHTGEESCQTCDAHQGWEKCQGSAMSLLGRRQKKHRGDVSSPS